MAAELATNIERYDQKAIILYSNADINSGPKDTISESHYNVKIIKCLKDWVYIDVDNNSGWISPEDQCNLAETSCAGGTRVAFESEEEEDAFANFDTVQTTRDTLNNSLFDYT